MKRKLFDHYCDEYELCMYDIRLTTVAFGTSTCLGSKRNCTTLVFNFIFFITSFMVYIYMNIIVFTSVRVLDAKVASTSNSDLPSVSLNKSMEINLLSDY